jgi:DNA-binding response OmpR family regulator
LIARQETKGRILFVNDDPDTFDLVTLILKEMDYETVVARNITDGLMMAKSQPFDLILIDWYFEDGMGLELCQNIRLFDEQTPIFFYTGECRAAEIKKALKAGAQGCLLKPVEIDLFLQTLSRQIAERKLLPTKDH